MGNWKDQPWQTEWLKTSDLMTAVTRGFNDYVYGRSLSVKKSGFAVLVSIFARLVSTNFQPLLGGAGETYTSQSSKNQIVVGLVNAVAAMAMKQNPLRTAMDAVSADLTAEWVLKALGTTIGNKQESWDYTIFPPMKP